jgi:AmmeMemoRadiSam system protein A
MSCTQNRIANLSTGCCSWPSVITLMNLTSGMPDITYKKLLYKNSGDSEYGEKNRVVGYYALSVLKKAANDSFLKDSDKKALLLIARNAIHSFLAGGRSPSYEIESLPPALFNKAGVFVTLKKGNKLRGCIGHFEADIPLYKIVQQMAVASSAHDTRFDAVTSDELELLDIEISVLSPLQKIDNVKNIRLGTDGIYIKKGGRSGTFLPQVASETGWNLEEFLGHCARDKAGIGWNGWQDEDSEIYIYQAVLFGEKE